MQILNWLCFTLKHLEMMLYFMIHYHHHYYAAPLAVRSRGEERLAVKLDLNAAQSTHTQNYAQIIHPASGSDVFSLGWTGANS